MDTGLPRAAGEAADSGDLETGTRLALCSMSFCRIGLEISRFLMLLRSGLAFLGRELNLPCFSFSTSLPGSLSATETLGVLFTLEMSLLRPEVSGLVFAASR